MVDDEKKKPRRHLRCSIWSDVILKQPVVFIPLPILVRACNCPPISWSQLSLLMSNLASRLLFERVGTSSATGVTSPSDGQYRISKLILNSSAKRPNTAPWCLRQYENCSSVQPGSYIFVLISTESLLDIVSPAYSVNHSSSASPYGHSFDLFELLERHCFGLD
jgi:hypothetical protein